MKGQSGRGNGTTVARVKHGKHLGAGQQSYLAGAPGLWGWKEGQEYG